jgi:hypothetical protein
MGAVYEAEQEPPAAQWRYGCEISHNSRLALAHAAAMLSTRAANVHFEDWRDLLTQNGYAPRRLNDSVVLRAER